MRVSSAFLKEQSFERHGISFGFFVDSLLGQKLLRFAGLEMDRVREWRCVVPVCMVAYMLTC